MSDYLILVDKNDKEVGIEEKLKAHQEGKLHRAFSILIFNSKGETLIHQRASSKYHCPGLWSNTCCSHPRPKESLETAIHRRLKEEFGFDCELKKLFSFTYTAKFENGLIENEYDHVFVGNFDGQPNPNPNEIDDWKWISMSDLQKDVNSNPDKYTPWFKIILKEIQSYQ